MSDDPLPLYVPAQMAAGIEISKYGAKITRALTLDEWKGSLHALKDIKEAWVAIFSDITAWGRVEYGDEVVANTLEQLQFNWSDAKRATLMAQIPLDFRLEYDLSPEITWILSNLLAEERLHWAKICKFQSLTGHQLKRSIEAGHVLTAEEMEQETGQGSGFSTIQGVRFQFEKWTRQMGDPDDILRMEKKDRNRILTVLEPIIELAAKIQESFDPTP